MTDDEVIANAARLCDRGDLLKWHDDIEVERLKRIINVDDILQARYVLPALLSVVERRGLKDVSKIPIEDDSSKNAVWAAAYGAAFSAHVERWHREGQPSDFRSMIATAKDEAAAVAELAAESLEWV